MYSIFESNSANHKSSLSIGNQLSDFTILAELGKGSYGVVYKVKSNIDKNVYVMKKMELKNLTEKQQQECWKEAMILKKVNHENIIHYYNSFLEKECLYIIMEYANGGDLYSLIKQYKNANKHFEEEIIWKMTYEILSGLEYLHENNIIHRDIKCLNLFICNKVIKIGDLGVSKLVSNINALQCTRVGTPLYLCPELIKQIPYDSKADIWSLGCCIYHLTCLDPPFLGDNLIVLGNKIVKGKPNPLPCCYSSALSEFINKLLSKKGENRPSAKEAFNYIPKNILEELKSKKDIDNNPRRGSLTSKIKEIPNEVKNEASKDIKCRPISSCGNRLIVRKEEKEITEEKVKENENEKENNIKCDSQKINETSNPNQDNNVNIFLKNSFSKNKNISHLNPRAIASSLTTRKEIEYVQNIITHPSNQNGKAIVTNRPIKAKTIIPDPNSQDFETNPIDHLHYVENVENFMINNNNEKEINSHRNASNTGALFTTRNLKLSHHSSKHEQEMSNTNQMKIREDLELDHPLDNENKFPLLKSENEDRHRLNNMKRVFSSKMRMKEKIHSKELRPFTASNNRILAKNHQENSNLPNYIPAIKPTRPMTAIGSNDKNNQKVINININFYNIDMNKRYLNPMGNPFQKNTLSEFSAIVDNEKKLSAKNNRTSNDDMEMLNIDLKALENCRSGFIFEKLIKTLEQAHSGKRLTINDL